MKFLPIVGRELRVAARRRNTYWMRSWIALLVMVVSAGIFLFSIHDSPREIGKTLFYTLTGGALIFCLFAGLRATADCLSEEKREGTLGLLFLTDLKGYDVVLGKLAANGLNGLYGLLAILPMMAIPLLLGGLTAGEFGRVAAVLLNALFFSLCLGMFASACSRSARKAIALTLLLVLLFTAALPALGSWLSWKHQWDAGGRVLAYSSAGFSYFTALELQFRTVGQHFYRSLGVVHALAWVFLGLACWMAPRSWQDRPASARGERWRGLWHGWSDGDTREEKAFRTRLLHRNPFFWLAARARLKPACVWAVLGAAGCIWLWGALEYGRDWHNEGTYLLTAFLLNSILKIWFASEAVRQLSEDRRLGTLELLLSTPLTVKDILRGQALALRRQFLGPVVAVLLVEAFMLAVMLETIGGLDRRVWITIWLAGMTMLVADLGALFWVGLWMALAAKSPKRAFSETIGRVLAVPWVLFVLFFSIATLSVMRGEPHASWKVHLAVWFGLGLLVDAGFGFLARHKLLMEFRELAARCYERRAGWWKRLFGGAGEADGET